MRASFGSIVAQVAEVVVADGNTLQVKRVTCAIDCGPVVNPAIVRAQMESGIIYGLSAALYGEITLANGAVEQSNFPDYDAVRLADAPAMTSSAYGPPNDCTIRLPRSIISPSEESTKNAGDPK